MWINCCVSLNGLLIVTLVATYCTIAGRWCFFGCSVTHRRIEYRRILLMPLLFVPPVRGVATGTTSSSMERSSSVREQQTGYIIPSHSSPRQIMAGLLQCFMAGQRQSAAEKARHVTPLFICCCFSMIAFFGSGERTYRRCAAAAAPPVGGDLWGDNWVEPPFNDAMPGTVVVFLLLCCWGCASLLGFTSPRSLPVHLGKCKTI